MPRHQKFYQNMKNGAYSAAGDYDDYDDEYDYDDDYDYDEEQAEYIADVAPTTLTTGVSSATAAASTATIGASSDTFGLERDVHHDFELLLPVLRKLKAIVPPSMSVTALVETIRGANYDEEGALAAATASPASTDRAQAQPPSRASSETTKGKAPPVPGVAPLLVGGKGPHVAKTLTLGAKGSTKQQGPSSATLRDDAAGSPEVTSGALTAADTVSPTTLSEASASASLFSPTGAAVRFTTAAESSVTGADGRQTITAVIAGHVDSGKSTLLGHLLVLLGTFSDRDVHKNEKLGKGTGKESFKYAWMMDQSEEERRRGVTIDAGTQAFSTARKHVTVLDCPGHIDFVMNMVTSATQADIALLVVTAARGEFESGLHHGTKEHLTILKTLGVSHILVVVNKMDTVEYSQERFDFVVRETTLMLKQTRFKESAVVGFCPVSGLQGINLLAADGMQHMPWYSGGSLTEMLDVLTVVPRLVGNSLRITVQDVGKGIVYGHVECGRFAVGDTVIFAPCGIRIKVKSITIVGAGAGKSAAAGDTVEIGTSSDLTGVYHGCVGCPPNEVCAASTLFEARIQTFSSMGKVMLPGSQYIFACHSLSVEVTVVALVSKMDKSGNWSRGMVKCITPDTQAVVTLRTEHPVALEPAENCRALGRFVLRQEGLTVGGGLVKRLL